MLNVGRVNQGELNIQFSLRLSNFQRTYSISTFQSQKGLFEKKVLLRISENPRFFKAFLGSVTNIG